MSQIGTTRCRSCPRRPRNNSGKRRSNKDDSTIATTSHWLAHVEQARWVSDEKKVVLAVLLASSV